MARARSTVTTLRRYSEPVKPADDRPDPDALLRIAAREGRGKLKVFLGAAPGVGKTYEMLSEAAGRRRGGTDVVIGVVETHGRAETEAMTRGHETIARAEIPHQGRTLPEMDLDAILERRPGLVLVDELAHSNAPGSRHPKRYQDVEELLAAGIDVYSTLNIQHLESLNDVVASFTHVRVRETVPDSVIESAEIEVVDIPPDELIERLKDGKVYVPDEATRALNHFFSKSNLSALRELALRRAAQAVDAQMLDYVREHALAGTWAGTERIVVAINELPGAELLVRTAKRISDALRAPWTAVHIETPRTQHFGEAEQRRIAAAFNLASQLGGLVATVPATSVFQGLSAFAVEARATQLIIGKSPRSRWFRTAASLGGRSAGPLDIGDGGACPAARRRDGARAASRVGAARTGRLARLSGDPADGCGGHRSGDRAVPHPAAGQCRPAVSVAGDGRRQPVRAVAGRVRGPHLLARL